MTVKPKYSVLVRALPDDDGGGWVAIVPDLPGCSSDGDTPMEALKNVQDAIEAWLATARKKHEMQMAQQNEKAAAQPNSEGTA